MILVTAATGQVGGYAAKRLLRRKLPVRVLVRDAMRAAGFDGADVAIGDFDDEASLTRALDGIETVFLAGRDSPNAVEQHRRALACISRAEVPYVVKLSAIGAAPDSPVALMRDHFEIDQELLRGPASWTLLKPHLFMQNLLRASDAVQREGVLSAPMGVERFPIVDTRDVGDAATTVLADPRAHIGKAYALTGPVAFDYHEIAAQIASVVKRPVRYVALSPRDYADQLIAAGIPEWRAFDLAHISAAYSASERAVSATLRQILEQPPRSFSTFLSDHVDAFRGPGN